MADSVHNLLLRITGEGDDAENALDSLLAHAAALDAQDVDIDVDVEGDEAAKARLAAVAKAAEALDDKDVDIDVNVDRDGFGRRALDGLISALTGATKAGSETGGMFNNVGVRVLGFSMQLSPLVGLILAVAYTAIGALIAGLAAMVASLTLAIGAIGALALAFVGVLGASVFFAIGLLQRFKDQADKAGTAANFLKKQFGPLGAAMKEAFAPGADLVFVAMAQGIKNLIPLIQALKPGINAFAEGVAAAIVIFTEGLGELAPELNRLLTQAGQVFPAIADMLIPLLGIILDIANAAMPWLIMMFERAGDAMRDWRKGTVMMEAFGGIIGRMMVHLESWWNLTKAIASVFLAFVGAAAESGLGLVDWLTQGANELARWLRSTEGKNRVAQFFDDVIPAVKSIIGFIGNMITLFAKIVEAAAPALKMTFDFLNLIISAVKGVIDQFMPLIQFGLMVAAVFIGPINVGLKMIGALFRLLGPLVGMVVRVIGPFLGIIARIIPILVTFGGVIIGALFAPVTLVIAAIAALVAVIIWLATSSEAVGAAIAAAWGWLKGAVVTVWNAIKDFIGLVWEAIKTVIQTHITVIQAIITTGFNVIKTVVTTIWNAIKTVISTVWNAIKTVTTTAVNAVKTVVTTVFNAVKSIVTSVWDAIKSATTTAWNAVKSAISTALNAAKSVVTSVLNAIKSAAKAAWDAVKSAAKTAWNAVKEVIGTAIRGALNIVKNLASSFFNAGKALIQSLVDGIKSMAGAVAGAVGDIAKGAASILPGSEPKDPRSPLRGLKDRGAAILGNMIEGITMSGPQLAATLRRELTVIPRIAAAASLQPALTPAATGQPPIGELHRHYHLAPGPDGGYEPRFVIAQIDDQIRDEGGLR